MNEIESGEVKQAKMYFVAIVLPMHLDERMLVYKKRMQELYGCKVGLKSPAHITILPPYWMDAEKEIRLKRDLENLAQTMLPFDLTTSDFSAFKPRTIFVAVKESTDLTSLKERTDDFFRQSGYGMKIESRPFHPHITIATRDLRKKILQKRGVGFRKKNFGKHLPLKAFRF